MIKIKTELKRHRDSISYKKNVEQEFFLFQRYFNLKEITEIKVATRWMVSVTIHDF